MSAVRSGKGSGWTEIFAQKVESNSLPVTKKTSQKNRKVGDGGAGDKVKNENRERRKGRQEKAGSSWMESKVGGGRGVRTSE